MKKIKAKKSKDIKVSGSEALRLILRYIKQKIAEQLKIVSGIIIYLILFQTLVLGVPIMDASIIGLGILMVILGLTLFLEGLLLGIMPMGEEVGIQLPTKAKPFAILSVAFFLGVAVTLAEPALAVLKTAGSSVLAWRAPLLFLLLNRFSTYLVIAIGVGVGLALLLSMLRFIKGWSLKPLIYGVIGTLMVGSFIAMFFPNLRNILGLSWDSGSVTTGPVTVPLLLAMGIGFSHVASGGKEEAEGGFGVVTVASLMPAIVVMALSFALAHKVPQPMDELAFFSPENTKSSFLFENEDAKRDYALSNASFEACTILFNGDTDALFAYMDGIVGDLPRIREVFGSRANMARWISQYGSDELKVKHSQFIEEHLEVAASSGGLSDFHFGEYLKKSALDAVRAIVPLTLFLLALLYLFFKERLRKPDEIFLGLSFAVIGMTLFGGGIDLGLAKMGDQVGSNLPVSFTTMQVPNGELMIKDFDKSLVYTTVSPDGSKSEVFYLNTDGKTALVPFEEENYSEDQKVYNHKVLRGPLFGKGQFNLIGIIVVILFAFIMGYSATLAEPALNALGITVEDITVGAFKKSMLIQSVAIGVGSGIGLGVAQVIWNIPIFYLLGPIYAILLVITHFSSEDYVNIGWDSAGVTTGPITVPLVLSMGLGIGGQVGVVEGFGIVSLASCCTIVSVLSMGLYVNLKRKRLMLDYEMGETEFNAGEVIV